MTHAEEDAPYSEECRKAVCELEQRFGVELVSIEHHEAAIRAAVAQERERCARVCEEWRAGLDNRTMQGEGWAAAECAAAIRRG